eukprot:3232165-Amphidinium_carterae.1
MALFATLGVHVNMAKAKIVISLSAFMLNSGEQGGIAYMLENGLHRPVFGYGSTGIIVLFPGFVVPIQTPPTCT